jgi:hypothetical protein
MEVALFALFKNKDGTFFDEIISASLVPASPALLVPRVEMRNNPIGKYSTH